MGLYRNLALEFNPEILKSDNAKQVFALIGEAYDVLSDPLRRAVFDQYGEEGLKRGVPTSNDYIPAYHYHGDPMVTYKEFFGTASPYADLLDVLQNPPLLYKMSDGNTSDVIFITEDRPHETFSREGDDLIMMANIILEEALLGTMITVKTIDHRTIRVPITDVISPIYEKLVENEGMPILERYPEKGNLIIKFSIEFPNYLPKNSKELMKKRFSHG
ncbi:hypothetical protein NQ314_007711 [Rhamnusium bicolor]|uniref:J domain-containing protein n=1 Tax=Rhamnusium bicolor TaxID=1586634 RepID=A0AAV8YJ17_9CUCU|nr:hypothetical protein NQ314_007711 [Rhamnusium bicolor]